MNKTKFWLIQHQLSSGSPQRRLQAVRKLRASTDAYAVKLLLEALGDLEGAVRTEAAVALGETLKVAPIGLRVLLTTFAFITVLFPRTKWRNCMPSSPRRVWT